MKKILFIISICLYCSFLAFSQSKKTWEKTVTLNTISGYESFIKEYPEGKFTELAKKFIEDLKANEAKKIEMDAKRAKALAIKQELYAKRIAREKAESNTDLPNGIGENQILSASRLGNLKEQLTSMSNPFTLKDLYNLAISKDVPSGSEIGGGGINTVTNNFTFKSVIVGQKVEIVSTIEGVLSMEIGRNGFMTIFRDEYVAKYNPIRLFTLYKPSILNSNEVYFEKIIIWESFLIPKNIFVFKEGKWYDLGNKL